MSDWTFRIWGCRGGIPVGGASNGRFGGLTTCLELELPEARIFIDAGSGFADAGRHVGEDHRDTLLLMSHLHADHVIGFPFFAPLYQKGWKLEVAGVARAGHAPWDFICQTHQPPLFPIAVGSALETVATGRTLPESGVGEFGGVTYRWMEVNHPGGCSAFELSVAGRRIIFSGDLEIGQMEAAGLEAFCAGADLLIFDAQYNDREYPHHVGWGHSTHLQAAEFAARTGVRHLVLTHHDPRHDDDEIERMEREAQAVFASTRAACCGMSFTDGDLD